MPLVYPTDVFTAQGRDLSLFHFKNPFSTSVVVVFLPEQLVGRNERIWYESEEKKGPSPFSRSPHFARLSQ